MPDLFLLVSEDDAELLKAHIDSIGMSLRIATAKTFPDLGGDPKKVAVWIVTHKGGSNIRPLQILGVASWKRDRVKLLEAWKKALADTWAVVVDRWNIPGFKERFPLDISEIFPTMPRATWGLVGPTARDF
jgi:hypothetical protein